MSTTEMTEVAANGKESVPDSEAVIQTEDLWRVYKLGDQEIPALRGINLRIGLGQYLALKGRSGSGKTTLLNCLGGLDQPTTGVVRVFGDGTRLLPVPRRRADPDGRRAQRSRAALQ